MPRYRITGGLVDIDHEMFVLTVSGRSLEWARGYAYETACEYYDLCVDKIPRRSIVQIMNEDSIDEETAVDIWLCERERWLIWDAVEIT